MQNQTIPILEGSEVTCVCCGQTHTAGNTVPLDQASYIYERSRAYSQLLGVAERLALIDRVIGTVSSEVESIADDCLGEALAYLAQAISADWIERAGNYVGYVDWSEGGIGEKGVKLTALFRQWFKPEDPVWKYIVCDPPAAPKAAVYHLTLTYGVYTDTPESITGSGISFDAAVRDLLQKYWLECGDSTASSPLLYNAIATLAKGEVTSIEVDDLDEAWDDEFSLELQTE